MSDIEQRLRGENPEKHTVVDRLRLYAAMPETFVFDSGDAVELDELALEAAGELARLEADNASLRSKMEEAEGALKAAREFIADEFNDDPYEESGEWLSPEARDVHKQLCEAEVALASLREADHA